MKEKKWTEIIFGTERLKPFYSYIYHIVLCVCVRVALWCLCEIMYGLGFFYEYVVWREKIFGWL